MITIDQLLESVDLDFEPRFVTKNLYDDIEIWSEKPDKTDDDWYEPYCASQDFGKLKLADFENKPWQECIYEVPRKDKPVVKIEKLNLLNDSALLWGKKINELVDMVNNIISVQEKMIDSRFVVNAVNELKGAKNE